jgi:hypothetical protein
MKQKNLNRYLIPLKRTGAEKEEIKREGSRSSSVSIVKRLQAERPGFDSR